MTNGPSGTQFDLLREIQSEWAAAEEDIKLAEQICKKVSFPSIKELRYAGRKVVEVIVAITRGVNQDDIDSLVRDIRHDCRRARHDAVDAGTAYIVSEITIAAKKLGYDNVLRAFPKFPDLHSGLNDIRVRIAESRKDTSSRGAIYSGIERNEFPNLVSLFREFQGAQPIMQALAKKEREHRVLILALGGIEVLVLIVALATHVTDIIGFLSRVITGRG